MTWSSINIKPSLGYIIWNRKLEKSRLQVKMALRRSSSKIYFFLFVVMFFWFFGIVFVAIPSLRNKTNLEKELGHISKFLISFQNTCSQLVYNISKK